MDSQKPRSNVPDMSVSELAFSLKKTLEETYGRVRVRGELSRVKIHSSGHLYSDLKDENALINAICWRGTLAKLSVRPEEGLEVICTGRISTYPARSNYQLIIDSMELAGEGALLKMLEERRKRLAAEGLFAAERKKKLPFLPERIGVITSPTGAVIRDILHRLADRFPRPVLIWPVAVQGAGAAEQVAAAIAGFNALPARLRPDLLIVARGGGSLEDLMAFNEESVVRAAAESVIPLISAIGHETDTTLIDYAADLRAPTPTGAAEMAVPRRLDLLAMIRDDERRLASALRGMLGAAEERLRLTAARLHDPARLLEPKIQRLDHAAHRLGAGFERTLSRRREQWQRAALRLSGPDRLVDLKKARLREGGQRLNTGFERRLSQAGAALIRHESRLLPPRAAVRDKGRALAFAAQGLETAGRTALAAQRTRLSHAVRMLDSLSYENVLQRGYVIVRAESGAILTDADRAAEAAEVVLEFRGTRKLAASIRKTDGGRA